MAKKILIVDDDVELAGTVADILQSGHYEVEIAYDGLQAIEKSNEQSIDVILLDIRMPFLSGIWFCDAFKRRSRTKDIPIVIVSAVTDEEEIQKAYRVGASAYLRKPFRSEELLKMVEKVLA